MSDIYGTLLYIVFNNASHFVTQYFSYYVLQTSEFFSLFFNLQVLSCCLFFYVVDFWRELKKQKNNPNELRCVAKK